MKVRRAREARPAIEPFTSILVRSEEAQQATDVKTGYVPAVPREPVLQVYTGDP